MFRKDGEHRDVVLVALNLKMGRVRNSNLLKFSCQSQSRPFLPRGAFPPQTFHVPYFKQKEPAISSENIQGIDR